MTTTTTIQHNTQPSQPYFLVRRIQIYQEKYRSWTLYVLSFTLTSLVAGLVYGWPALRDQLLEDGSTLTESELGVIFTVGSWSTQGGRFFVGLARDRFGTKRVVCCCMLLVTLGCLGIGLSDPDNAAALSSSLFLVGLGSGVQLCTQPVASLFPNHVGITLSSLSGAFQISGLAFLVLTSGDRPRMVAFVSYAGGLFLLTGLAVVFYPAGKSFLLENNMDEEKEEPTTINEQQTTKTSTEVNDSENVQSIELLSKISLGSALENDSNLERCSNSATKEKEADFEKHCLDETPQSSPNRDDDASESRTDDEILTAMQQMKTSEYILLCTWFSISLIPMQYYVGSIGFQLEERGDESGFYTDLFAYTYAGATVTAPLAGFLADSFGLGVAQGVGTCLVAISLFILAFQELSLVVHSFGLVAYGVGRMATFGLYFTNCGMRFGYSNFGTLAGLGLLISAIFSLLQYPLISLAAENKSSTINTILGIVLVLQTPYFIWLGLRERKFQSANTLNSS